MWSMIFLMKFGPIESSIQKISSWKTFLKYVLGYLEEVLTS